MKNLATSATSPLRILLLLFPIIDVILLLAGVILHPAALSFDLLPALLMQAIYAVSAWIWAKGAPDSTEMRFGLIFGILIALIFVGAQVVGALIILDNNTSLGQAEYGAVLVLIFACGLIGAWQSGNVRSAVIAAIWSAMLGSLALIGAVLLFHYLFVNTTQQRGYQAEGTLEFFRQSGMTDLESFVLQDFWGAGLYHLLFTPLVALIIGGIGSGMGIALRSVRRTAKLRA